MKVLGVTGGIGSGKSTIARFYDALGVPVFEADKVAKELMSSDQQLKNEIKSLLGEATYKEGVLNRAFIAEAIFSNPVLRHGLNSVVHPAVQESFEFFKRTNATMPYVVYEAALIRENGKQAEFDALIVAEASPSIRMTRVLERDPFRSEKEVQGIMLAQYSGVNETNSENVFCIETDDREMITPKLLQIDRQIRGEVA